MYYIKIKFGDDFIKEIAVLLATYNGEKYLQEQINSLINQTVEITIFVSDDCSTDATAEILKTNISNNKNIDILEKKKMGSAQKNFSYLLETVFALKKYDYYMFCDQDDIWLPNKVQQTVDEMQFQETKNKDQAILIHSDLKIVDSKLNIINESFWRYAKIDPEKNNLRQILLRNTVTGCTTMINNKLAELSIPFPEEFLHDWWLAMLASSVGKINIIKEPTILYRLHDSNSAGIENYNTIYIFKKFFSLFKKGGIDYFSKYIFQAELLDKRVHNIVQNENRDLLDKFISLKIKNKMQKLIMITKYKIFKHDLLSTLGMYMQILIKRDSV